MVEIFKARPYKPDPTQWFPLQRPLQPKLGTLAFMRTGACLPACSFVRVSILVHFWSETDKEVPR